MTLKLFSKCKKKLHTLSPIVALTKNLFSIAICVVWSRYREWLKLNSIILLSLLFSLLPLVYYNDVRFEKLLLKSFFLKEKCSFSWKHMKKLSTSGSEYFINMFKHKRVSFELRKTTTISSLHALNFHNLKYLIGK